MSKASKANPFAGLSNKNFNFNNSLTLLEYPSKNTLIERSSLESPFEMNNEQSIGKYMICAHGSVMEVYTFKVPRNINFITLVKLGYKCPAQKPIVNYIIKLYKNGNTLFQKDDTSKKLTLEGKSLLENLKLMFPEDADAFDFKNHKGGTIANEMFLRFVRDSSTEGRERCIGIRDILKSNKNNQPKNITNLNNSTKRTKIDQILLSSLLNMYENDRKKVFIINSCRIFQRDERWAGHNWAGEISRRANNTPSYNP